MGVENEIRVRIAEESLVIYLDECAAGVLAGDLFVCGVVFDEATLSLIPGVNDSKKLSEKRRAALYPEILGKAVAYEVVRLSAAEVDSLNILQARMEGFRRAIGVLAARTGAKYAVIDGDKKPDGLAIDTDYLVKADALLPGVSCASIVAKHSHTLYMEELCKNPLYSRYGFMSHKGYGTAEHLAALKEYGPLLGFHRLSYKPVRDSLL